MNPQYVSTNNARLHPGGLVETAESFAKVTIKAIGKTNMTCGTWKHNVFAYVVTGLERLLRHSNWQQYMNEGIIRKKAAAMWAKRL